MAWSVKEARARYKQRVCTRCADPRRPLRGCAQVIETDLEWRQSQFKVDNLRADYGKLNKEVAAKKKAKEDAEDLIAKAKNLDAEIKVPHVGVLPNHHLNSMVRARLRRARRLEAFGLEHDGSACASGRKARDIRVDRLQASAIDFAPHAHPRLSQAAEVECDEVAKKRDEMLKGIGNLVPDSVPCSDDEGKNTPACGVWLRPHVCACDAHVHKQT